MVWAGVFKYANGDLYDGEWKEDKQNRRGGGGGLLPYIDAAGRGGVALLKGWKEWICGNGRGGQGGGALAVVVRETSDGREWRCRRGRLGPG